MSYETNDVIWQSIDWSYVPETGDPWVKPEAVSYSFAGVPSLAHMGVSTEDGMLRHERTVTIDDLLDLYRDSGFDTDIILQNWLTHTGPSAACPIGFPTSFPGGLESSELSKFRRWICRVHVDIKRDNGDLISIPHIEPDPAFHPVEHLRFQGQEVYGKTAVSFLRTMLG
jgi:hypothetical protein